MVCKSCIARSQTIRALKHELAGLTKRYNEEFAKKQAATKKQRELDNVERSMRIDAGKELARLQASVKDRA